MKKLVLATAAAMMTAGMALADPVLGIWKTEVDDGAYAHVTMSKCGAQVCGVITKTFNSGGEYSSPNLGKQLVWDMVPNGGNAYRDGKIWQPSTGKVYSSKMDLNGDVLKVKGCIGPFCKKQTWNRVK